MGIKKYEHKSKKKVRALVLLQFLFYEKSIGLFLHDLLQKM
jgi:hypothetical protein